MAARRRAAAAVGVLGSLVGAFALVARSLGVPRAGSWGEASVWYEQVGPARAVIGCVSALALVVALWLLAAALLQLLAACAPTSALRSMADLISPRSLQRLVRGLAGVSLSAGLTVAAPSAGFTGGPPGADTATLRLAPPTPLTSTAPVPVPEAAPPAAPAPKPAPVTVAATVIVEAGDSLWSLAEEALVDAGDPHPSVAAVTSYWRRVIAENRQVLVVPDNPDLIYVGQVITLPSLA